MEEGHSWAVTRHRPRACPSGTSFLQVGTISWGGPVTWERRFMKQCDFAFPVDVPYTWFLKNGKKRLVGKVLAAKQECLRLDPRHPRKSKVWGLRPETPELEKGTEAGGSQGLPGQSVWQEWGALGSVRDLVSKDKGKHVVLILHRSTGQQAPPEKLCAHTHTHADKSTLVFLWLPCECVWMNMPLKACEIFPLERGVRV